MSDPNSENWSGDDNDQAYVPPNPESGLSEDDDNDPDYVPPDEMENGHITQSSNSNTDYSDSSEEDNQASSNNGQFDTDLPTAHRYLGKLNNVSGYTLYDDGEIIDILAIYTTTMVFPGFTLPLVMNNYVETTMMQNFIEKNNVFVLLCANANFNGIYNFGVTMEIFETQMRNNVLTIKAKGRQRCKLVPGCEIKNWAGRLKQVTIKIIAEPEYSSPLCDTQMLSLKRKRLFTSTEFCDIMKNYKYRRYHLTQYPLPSWIYDKYEISYYVKLLLNGLSHYVGDFTTKSQIFHASYFFGIISKRSENAKLELTAKYEKIMLSNDIEQESLPFKYIYIPRDPVMLSYWFVQNYQLNHEERLHILKLNSALERLRLEYRFLKQERKMCCNSCGMEITDPSKVFAMSKDGIQSNYVNPGGHVYETVTVMSAENFQLVGNPSKQFSWFPGYAWTIMQCNFCNNHLGWRFTSTILRPNCFYGLAKSGFKVVIQTKVPPDEQSDEIQSKRTTYSTDYIP